MTKAEVPPKIKGVSRQKKRPVPAERSESERARPGTVAHTHAAEVFAREALDLRIRGYSYPAISDYLTKKHERPITYSMVYNAVSKRLEDARVNYREKANEVLQMEIDRCDRMISALEPHCVPPDQLPDDIDKLPEDQREAAIEKLFRPSLKAMDAMEKLLDRKAKLMGFYKGDENKAKEVLAWSDEEEKPLTGTPE